MLMAEAVAGDDGLDYERDVRLPFVLAGGGNVDPRQKTGVASEKIIRTAVFLNQNDDVLDDALLVRRLLRV
jgi:hypothetical protein